MVIKRKEKVIEMSKKEQKIIEVLKAQYEVASKEYRNYPKGSELYQRNLSEMMKAQEMIWLLTDKKYLDDIYEIWKG